MAALPISVVIPAYNASAYLAEALESVRQQTAPPIEIIVVDDGSTDATAAIARAAGAIVLSQANMGISAARNAGIRAATQPWVALLDADDLWEPDKLRAQWEAAEACPEVGAVFTNFVEFDTNGQIGMPFFSRVPHYHEVMGTRIGRHVLRCEHRSLQEQFFRGNFIAPSTLLVRRLLLLQVGLFDVTLTHCEDRECWLRLIAASSMAVVETPLSRSRIQPGNWSRDSLRMLLGAIMVTDRIFVSPDRYPPGAAEHYGKSRPDLYVAAGRVAEDAGDIRRAREYYLQGWRLGSGGRALALAFLSLLPEPLRSLARAVRLSLTTTSVAVSAWT
jgi:glycosyltransferase involved in cell wall biosynthesis